MSVEHSVEKDAPRVVTEYAIVRGETVLYWTADQPIWNESITLHEAAERWYSGSEVVTRTRTVYPDVLTDWTRVTSPGGPFWEHHDGTPCPNVDDTHMCSEHGEWTRVLPPGGSDV